MKVLDLFSGIGGFSLGLERAGMETVAFCEFDEHARKVLKKHWPDIPIHKDVRELDGKQYRGTVDVVCGGFPCQDLSTAGKQAGFSGERSSLYREMLRIISECLPRYAIFENVTGLLSGDGGRWFARFLYDLAEVGYDAEWHCISASELGASHHRDRVWVVAYPHGNNDSGKESGRAYEAEGVKKQNWPQVSSAGIISGADEDRAPGDRLNQASSYADMQRCERFAKIAHILKQQIEFVRSAESTRERFHLSESTLCGADDGVPNRSHRLKQLGNAVVPQIPEAIGRAIMEAEL